MINIGIPNYETGIACLQENLKVMADDYGNVALDNRPIWNVSNALLVALDALRGLDLRVQKLEQQVQQISRPSP